MARWDKKRVAFVVLNGWERMDRAHLLDLPIEAFPLVLSIKYNHAVYIDALARQAFLVLLPRSVAPAAR